MGDEKLVVREQVVLSERVARRVLDKARGEGISRSAALRRLVETGLGMEHEGRTLAWRAEPNLSRTTDD